MPSALERLPFELLVEIAGRIGFYDESAALGAACRLLRDARAAVPVWENADVPAAGLERFAALVERGRAGRFRRATLGLGADGSEDPRFEGAVRRLAGRVDALDVVGGEGVSLQRLSRAVRYAEAVVGIPVDTVFALGSPSVSRQDVADPLSTRARRAVVFNAHWDDSYYRRHRPYTDLVASAFPHARTLDLVGCFWSGFGGRDLRPMASLETLRVFDSGRSGDPEYHAMTLVSAFLPPGLRSLAFDTFALDAGLYGAARVAEMSPRLRELSWRIARIDRHDAAALKAMRGLERLSISTTAHLDCDFDELAAALAAVPAIDAIVDFDAAYDHGELSALERWWAGVAPGRMRIAIRPLGDRARVRALLLALLDGARAAGPPPMVARILDAGPLREVALDPDAVGPVADAAARLAPTGARIELVFYGADADVARAAPAIEGRSGGVVAVRIQARPRKEAEDEACRAVQPAVDRARAFVRKERARRP